MAATTQTKFLLTLTGLLTIVGYYQLNQYNALASQLETMPQQCEARASDLLKNRAAPAIPQTISLHSKAQPKAIQKPAKISSKHSAQSSTDQISKEQPKLQRFDESLEDIALRKYRFLLAKLDLSPAEKEHLLQLLIQREGVALALRDAELFSDELNLDPNKVTDLQWELNILDEKIADILDDGDNGERYALLKDSEHEQEEFNQYTLGVSGLFPLEQPQQETVLMSRLKHKQTFETALTEAGFNLEYPLSKAQQQSLLENLEQAAYRYKESFLDDVRPHLDHSNFPMDQYTMLENYTKTEFNQLVNTLREKVESRGVY